MAHWNYECSCRDCAQIQEIHTELRDGFYCRAVLHGYTTIHADDDRTVRCDCYTTDAGGILPPYIEKSLNESIKR